MEAKWATVFTIGGWVGAAIFYSPYLNGGTQLVCPFCPHVTIVGGTLFSRFLRPAFGGGVLNAVSLIVVGCLVIGIARKLKKTEKLNMATPEHKLTGKSAEDSADQPAPQDNVEQPTSAPQVGHIEAGAEQCASGSGAEQPTSGTGGEHSTPGSANEQIASPQGSGQDRDLQSAQAASGSEKLDESSAPGQTTGGAELTASPPESAQDRDAQSGQAASSPEQLAVLAASEQSASRSASDQSAAGGGAEEKLASPGSAQRLDSALEQVGSGGYKIHIPMYEGPLDLLLDLIRQQKMSIHDIQISLITAQYLDYLHKLEELDVDVSAEFIYMAATLIYIKSKMLLPPDPLATPEEQAADPRAELVQRLVEHEKFKSAAQILYQKQQIEENVWSKPDKTLYQDPGTEGELVVSLVDLVKVFQQVLERRKETVRIELHHEQFTVAQMIVQLRAQIISSVENAVSLIQFFEACPSRHAMIVAFLAVLEMVKLQAVALVQENMFGDIVVKKGRAFDVVFDENGAIKMVDEEYR